MKLDLKDIPSQLASRLQAFKRYATIAFILFFLCLYAFLVVRINSLSQAEPAEDVVLERLSGKQQPRVDEAAIEKIKQLQGQNVEVETLFKQARDNPFSE